MTQPSNSQIIVGKTMENKYAPYFVAGLVVVGGVLGYFFVLRPVLEATNLKETTEEKRIKKMPGFDPNYYREHLTKVTISTEQAKYLAKLIYTSYGPNRMSGKATLDPLMGILTTVATSLNDDEEQLEGAIQQAGSEYNLSKVSDIFFRDYKQGMLSYIENFSGNSDIRNIYQTIKQF